MIFKNSFLKGEVLFIKIERAIFVLSKKYKKMIQNETCLKGLFSLQNVKI